MGIGEGALLLVALIAAVMLVALANWVLARHDRGTVEDDPYRDWRGDDPGQPWDRPR